MKRPLLTVAFALGIGCRSSPPPAPPVAAAPVAPPPRDAPPSPSPEVAPPDPVALYREAVEREVAGARRLRRLETFEGPVEVRTFRGRRRQDGVLFLTLRAKASARPELLARADRSRAEVAEVLVAVAEQCTAATPCRGYSPVALPEPVHGLQFFDLVPAGEARIDDQDVRLLRVLPLTPEEYEAARSETSGAWSGAGSADSDGHASAAARWAPAFEANESSNSSE